MKTLNSIVAVSLVTLMALTSCNSLKVVTDIDRDVDFSSFVTYQLQMDTTGQEPGKMTVNHIDQKRIESALTEQVQVRGMIESETPDVYLKYSVGIESFKYYRTQTNYTRVPDYYYASYKGRIYRVYRNRYVPDSGYTTESERLDGKLYLSLVDANSGKVIWLSEGSHAISSKPNKRDKLMKKVVAQIFEEFPAGKQILPENNQVALQK